MAQYGWLVKLDKCIGCESCVVACKAENNTPPTISPLQFKNDVSPIHTTYRWVVARESGTYPNVSKVFVTTSCNHCKDPACLAACPVSPKAITKRDADGVVIIDQDLCIGCKYCIWACPYGAPQYNASSKKVEKCTFCLHRVTQGLQPACVTTCVGNALEFVSNFSTSDSGANKPDGFADPGLTTPSVKFENG
jgi:Fe-S-cluster-containing dehydrogenase component